MNKSPRRKIDIETVKDIPEQYNMTKLELIAESKLYDREEYVIDETSSTSNTKCETVTLRLTPIESNFIKYLAWQNGLSKSALIRKLITIALECIEEEELNHLKVGK